MSEHDRISYSYGFKVPGAEQYSSVNVTVSLSTDVKAGETPDQAMERAKAFVHAHSDEEMPQEPTRRRQPPMTAELFDPSNSVHLRLAKIVFEKEGVTSEKARAYVTHQLLKGAPVGAIGEIVRKNNEDYRGRRA